MSGEVRTQLTEVFILDTSTTIKKILNVADVGEFGPQADDIEVTNLESTAKEFLTGLGDNGEVTLQLNLIPTDLMHQLLAAQAGSGTRYQFAVCLSEGATDPTVLAGAIVPPAASVRTTFIFTASVKAFRHGIKANDAVRTHCVLRISGAIATTWKV